MGSNTQNLNLYKANPINDKTNTFNIDTLLNENWDKIDQKAGDHETRVATIENEYSQSNYSTPITETSSVISLPSTTVYGQLNVVRLFGNTRTNLLTDNQASIETDTTGFAVVGTTISRDTTEKYFGGASLKVITDGLSTNESVRANNVKGINGKTYTASVYVKAPSGTNMHILLRRGVSANFSTQSFTGTGNWQRISTTLTLDADTSDLGLWVRSSDAVAITFHIDGLMIEEGTEVKSFITSTKSTFSDEGDSLLSVGKNLFDKSKVDLTGDLDEYGNVRVFEGRFTSNYIKIEPNTNYTKSFNDYVRTAFYDSNKNFISITTNQSFITPSNAMYLKIAGNTENLDLYQLEEGTTAIEYEEHKSSENYPPVLRSLPNGTKDEISEDGKFVQKISDDVTLSSVISTVSGTNVDLAKISDSNLSTLTGETTVSELSKAIMVRSDTKRYEVLEVSTWDDTTHIGKAYASTSGGLYIVIEKSTTFTDFPITLNYQLAEPVITEGAITPLTCFENGTLIVNSTVLPEITWSVPINRSAQMDSNTGAINQLSKDIGNIWDSLLPLADKELSMALVSTITTDMSADANDNELKNKINEILNIWV